MISACRRPARRCGDQGADAAEADDADRLLEELDAGVLGALPLAALAARRWAGGMWRARLRMWRDGELGGGDDVGGRGVDHHDARLCGRLHVTLLRRTGPGHDLEPLRRGERLGVHLGGGPHEDGVDVRDGGQQLGAVGTVAVADLELGAQRVDSGGAQLFGVRDDGTRSHSEVLHGIVRVRVCTMLCQWPQYPLRQPVNELVHAIRTRVVTEQGLAERHSPGPAGTANSAVAG